MPDNPGRYWLYAGGTGGNGGELWEINPANGAAAFVGPTGFGSVTGLTMVIPEPGALALLGIGALGASRKRR